MRSQQVQQQGQVMTRRAAKTAASAVAPAQNNPNSATAVAQPAQQVQQAQGGANAQAPVATRASARNKAPTAAPAVAPGNTNSTANAIATQPTQQAQQIQANAQVPVATRASARNKTKTAAPAVVLTANNNPATAAAAQSIQGVANNIPAPTTTRASTRKNTVAVAVAAAPVSTNSANGAQPTQPTQGQLAQVAPAPAASRVSARSKTKPINPPPSSTVQNQSQTQQPGPSSSAGLKQQAVSKKRQRKAKKPRKVTQQQASDDEEEEEEDKENDAEDSDPDLPITLKSRKKLKLDTTDDGSISSPARRTKKTNTKEAVVAEVDPECGQKYGKATVYCEPATGAAYSAMLNQTNQRNNNNKFYVMQVLQEAATTGATTYSTWLRWGRVGYRGAVHLSEYGADLGAAIREFENKFHAKTNNQWANRAAFQKVPGKYDLIEVTRADEKQVAKAPGVSKTIVRLESKLEPAVQHLMELICDMRAMEADVRRMDFDVQRSPLGQITKAQLKAGFESLTRIEKHIIEGQFNVAWEEAVNEYYTRIPHNFRFKTPPAINSLAMLKAEIELLETLAGIELAVTAINQQVIEEENPLDQRCRLLRYTPRTMSPTDSMFKLIDDYLQHTHAGTHGNYKMAIRNVYELMDAAGAPGSSKTRAGANKAKGSVGNRRLLWHGSRLTNWFGILSQGLRIAPPEAPVTGYMFGKGVYFADASSKSANYTYPVRGQPGLLVLAEVDLGVVEERMHADQSPLPVGKHSVKGVGQWMPDSKSHVTLPNDVLVPTGKLVQNKLASSLLYNEYIVYDTTQIRERYLVEVDFRFTY